MKSRIALENNSGATYNKNEMLPQRKGALEKWSEIIEGIVGRGEKSQMKLSYDVLPKSILEPSD